VCVKVKKKLDAILCRLGGEWFSKCLSSPANHPSFPGLITISSFIFSAQAATVTSDQYNGAGSNDISKL